MVLYLLLILGVATSRLYEVRLSKQHLKEAQTDHDAYPYPEGIYPWMVAFHTGWLISCAVEVVFWNRSFHLFWGSLMIAFWGLSLLGRLWMLQTMKSSWNVRVVHHPEQQVVSSGPYRYCRHPNYLIVMVEIFCIPMIHGAYGTALLGTLINFWLIRKRLETEEPYLATLPAYQETMAHLPRFIPEPLARHFRKNSR